MALTAALTPPPQPISNRFLKSKSDKEELFELSMCQCTECGMVQLSSYPAAAELCPTYDWISYREPEGHLDQMTALMSRLNGLSPDSAIGGFSYKDDSTLERLRNSGFNNIYRLDIASDFEVNNPKASIETVQSLMNVELARRIVKRRGKFKLLLVRHVLEHAHSPRDFIAGLSELVEDDGYIVFEVPDCEGALAKNDYTTIWEEHTLYFTPSSLRNCLSVNSLRVQDFIVYPYPFENSLCAIVRKGQSQKIEIDLDTEIARGRNFLESFAIKTEQVRSFLEDCRKQQGAIAIFGAGHLSGSFVTLHGVAEFIEFMVDDNEHKQQMLMPGSRLPIYPSSRLSEANIKICLLGFNPELEERVVNKFASFGANGGKFYSIFPGSPRRVPI